MSFKTNSISIPSISQASNIGIDTDNTYTPAVGETGLISSAIEIRPDINLALWLDSPRELLNNVIIQPCDQAPTVFYRYYKKSSTEIIFIDGTPTMDIHIPTINWNYLPYLVYDLTQPDIPYFETIISTTTMVNTSGVLSTGSHAVNDSDFLTAPIQGGIHDGEDGFFTADWNSEPTKYYWTISNRRNFTI